MQIRLMNGSIVNVFDSGTANVQGVANEEVKALFRAPVTRRVAAPAAGGVTLVLPPQRQREMFSSSTATTLQPVTSLRRRYADGD